MHPTRRPMTTAVDFMMGAPKRSQRMMVRKTEKPRPMNSALPQGSACGALMLGQSWKRPVSGRLAQALEPPAQFWKPVSMRWMPMSMTVGPVTSGGKMRLRMRGGVKDMRISRSAQTHCVPRMAPYPSGQGSLFPLASTGQKPVWYIWERAPVAMGMVAKEVPTTEMRPVPM